jgi:hypothetical protein
MKLILKKLREKISACVSIETFRKNVDSLIIKKGLACGRRYPGSVRQLF